MTPEERAAKIVEPTKDIQTAWLIVAAIRTAVEEERMACMKIADKVHDECLYNNEEAGAWREAAFEIGESIRKRREG